MSTYALRVARKDRETADCASLWLEVPTDLDNAFEHRPGQFLTVMADIDGETLARQYSISSLWKDPRGLRITVKKVPGGKVSTWIVDEVEAGNTIEVGAPRGVFFKPLDGAHRVLLLACGSGIAPILPIAQKLLKDGAGHRVALIFGSRSVDEIILRSEVDQISEQYRTAQLEHLLSRPGAEWQGARGRIDAAYLAANAARWHPGADHLPLMIYLCGPEAFMDAAEEYFLAQGVDPAAIRRESFDLVLADDEAEPPLVVSGTQTAGEESETCEEIVANVGGEVARVVPEAGETILGALLRGDAPVPYSCQEGTCSSCISKLKEGTAHVRPGVLKSLRQDDLDSGLVLSCLAKPASRKILIDFDDI
jgi:ferredoxin-NADP reductase